MHDRKDDAQRRIIAAAQAEMIEHGYADANVDRIAARANTSKQTIYLWFPAKERLLVAAVKAGLAVASERGVPSLVALAPLDALKRLAKWAQQRSLDPVNQGLYRVNIAAANLVPELADEAHVLRRRAASPMQAYIETLSVQGARNVGDPIAAAGRFGVLAIAGIDDLVRSLPADGCALDARSDSVARLFLYGWRKEGEMVSPGAEALRAAGELALFRSYDPPASDPPSSGARSRLASERIELLLDTAARAFLEKGFRHAAVDAISAATGISKMTIYRQFGDKETLFERAITSFAGRIARERRPLPLAGETRDALMAAAMALDVRHARQDVVRLLRLAVTEAQRWPVLAHAILDMLRSDDLREIADFLAARHVSGELRIDDPLLAASHFRLLAIRGNMRLTGTSGDAMAEEDHAREVVSLVMDGVW